MKRIVFPLLILILFCNSAFGQLTMQGADTDCAQLTFIRDTINFGDLKHDAEAWIEMKYKNTGKCPLAIYSTNGLPVLEYKVSKLFLQAHDSGTISIFYPTNITGTFFKILTFATNAGNKYLFIRGNIKTEDICADMHFASDTMDFGAVNYVFGKHFVIKVPSTGKCPLRIRITPANDYMNVIDYPFAPINPGDTGIINIHIGGPLTGHYYGLLNINSPNALTAHKTLFIKAAFMPPDKGDSTDTEIKVDKDIVDIGETQANKEVTVQYTITNTGKMPLTFKPIDAQRITIKGTHTPLKPGKSCIISATFNTDSAIGAFIQYIVISGNFKGKSVPLYIKGNIRQ